MVEDNESPLRVEIASEVDVPEWRDGEMPITVTAKAGGCRHAWTEDGPNAYFTAVIGLGCEPHDYYHLWAYACLECGEQFWPDHVNCDSKAYIRTYLIDGAVFMSEQAA